MKRLKAQPNVVYFSGLFTTKQIASVSFSETVIAIGSSVTFPTVTIHDSSYSFAGWMDDKTGEPCSGNSVIPTRDKAVYKVLVGRLE
jgi:hypothetical protein